MDTSDYPSLGRLARFSAQLLAQNSQVAAMVDSQLDQVERLFHAAAQRDWEAVLRLSEELANQQQDRANKAVIRSARKVCDSLGRDPSGAKATRRLSELLAACRDAKVKK